MTATETELVTLQIDGREVTVPAGTLLWHAARSAGIDIPIFCYHPKMPPIGACRMCLVEVEKMPKLQTACTTPVVDGMVVHTQSEKTKGAQENVLEFLLINHPLDCPVCDKGGECPLQDQTYKWGPGRSRYEESKVTFPKPIPLSSKVLLDRERCIICFRCVRFQSEIAGDESLTVLNRGTYSEIGLAPGRTFDSPFSGNTIELCPVGALTSAEYRFRARPWDLNVSSSVCGLCPMGCNVRLSVRKQNEMLMRVTSRENPHVDDGWLCDRGRFDYEYVNSEERLTQPLVRRGDKLVPVSYDEAIAEAARLLSRAGASGEVGGVVSTRSTNEEMYLLRKLLKEAFNSPHLDYGFDSPPSRAPLGHDAAAGSIEGLEKADLILLVGVRPVEQAPVLELRIRQAVRNGAKVAEISGRQTGLGELASLAVCPRLGLEGEVLLGVCAAILDEGLQDAEWVAERTRGVEGLCEALSQYTPEEVERRLRLKAGSIREMARLVATADNVTIIYDRAYTHERKGGPLLAGVTNLALLTGNLGREGAGPFGLVRGPNEQGALDLGMVPGEKRGMSGRGMLARLRSMVLLGTEPVEEVGGDDQLRVSSALGNMPALIVFAPFANQLTERAHVVFPATTYPEKEGTYTNLERRVQRLRPGRTLYGVRQEWLVLSQIASALGHPFPYRKPAEVWAEISERVPRYAGMTYGRLGSKGLQWPVQDVAGTPVLYTDPEQRWQFVGTGG